MFLFYVHSVVWEPGKWHCDTHTLTHTHTHTHTPFAGGGFGVRAEVPWRRTSYGAGRIPAGQRYAVMYAAVHAVMYAVMYTRPLMMSAS